MDERICDLCRAVRAVVHCEADAAYLCLCCDAKVHNPNTLVRRHSRRTILLCDSCSYKGCPSANEFAAFWGFKLDHISSTSTTTTTSRISSSTNRSRRCGSAGADIMEVHTGINPSCSQIEGLIGSTSLTHHHKISHQLGDLEQKNSTSYCLILDQIIDLNRLQLSLLCGQDQQISRISSSLRHTSKRVQHNLHHQQCNKGDHQAAADILTLPQLDDDDHKHLRSYPCSSSSSSNSMDASVGDKDSTCIASKKVQNLVGSLEYSPCRIRARAKAMMKYKAKKHSRLLGKKIRYPSRKATVRARKRVQG